MPSDEHARVDVFDPKGEIVPFLTNSTQARVFEHESASEAARASVRAMREDNDLGICVLEEVMTIPPSEYAEITRLAAIRRKDTSGKGIAIYATTQRPKIMPVAVRSIADLWLVGSITDDEDLKAIGKVAGSEFTDLLPGAAIGDFYIYDFGQARQV